MHQKHTNIGNKCLNDAPQHNHLLTQIAAQTTQDGNTVMTNLAGVPAPNEDPDVLAPFLELNGTV